MLKAKASRLLYLGRPVSKIDNVMHFVDLRLVKQASVEWMVTWPDGTLMAIEIHLIIIKLTFGAELFTGWSKLHNLIIIVWLDGNWFILVLQPNGVFPKWSRTVIEFSDLNKFRESGKSLKHELGFIWRSCLSSVTWWRCGSILVS